jgi:putative glutamine amidotransferase
MTPLIGVTTTLRTPATARGPQVILNAGYVEAVERPGAVAVLLSPAHSQDSLNRLLDTVHGLVLTGGEDVDPARYGQAPHPALGTVTPERDEMEFAVLEGALERGLPVLAICRGLQLLNVALGGTLYQDLPVERPDSIIVHEQEAPIDQRWHAARVDEHSCLHDIFGSSELFINSFHHQAIRTLAPALKATVWAEDGLIEGVESTQHPWVIGVQWHPERGEADLPHDKRDPDRRLMWEFVNVVRTRAQVPTPALP